MIDLKFIKDNEKRFEKAIKDKQLEGTVNLRKLLRSYDEYLDVLKKVELHRNLKNNLSDEVARASGSGRQELVGQAVKVKGELKALESKLGALKMEIDAAALFVPNIPADDVPVGKDETGNVVVRYAGEKPSFNFDPRDHLEIGKALDIIDVGRGAKISGFRGYFLKNQAALLSNALLQYAIDFMVDRGFTFMTVPTLVRPEFFVGTGFFPWGKDDHYGVCDDLALVGTAEVSLTSYYSGEILAASDLPVKLVGLSACYRREIGTYGKDTKGVFRVHEFNKVEQVILVESDENASHKWHEKILNISEEFLTALGLHYRVVLMCTGDTGAAQRKKYDIETWFPGQNAYRETHSASYFSDFQSRRLNIRYKDNNGDVKYVHTLNNTVAATPRLLAVVLETYQQKDGSVKVPEALRPYVNFEIIKPKG